MSNLILVVISNKNSRQFNSTEITVIDYVYFFVMVSYLLVKTAQISILPHAAEDLRRCFHDFG